MPDLSDLATSSNNANKILSQIALAIAAAFPQAASTTITTTATSGAQTLPGNPAGFLTVTVNGVPFKIPLYNP